MRKIVKLKKILMKQMYINNIISNAIEIFLILKKQKYYYVKDLVRLYYFFYSIVINTKFLLHYIYYLFIKFL